VKGEGVHLNTEWFLALDGDDIGRQLELYMLTNDIGSLRAFAKAFNSTVDILVASISEICGAELILSGGDSILIKLTNEEALGTALKTINSLTSGSEFTFSGGYADTMQGAYLALKLAKSSGKNRIEGPLSEAVGD
jgi:hypothetical protein